MRRALTIAAAVLLTGCVHGTQLRDFRPAQSPEGAHLRFRLDGQKQIHQGELFAVDETGIFVKTDRLVHVRWDRMNAVDFEQLGQDYDYYGSAFKDGQLARIARVSRFPQGFSPPLLASVLAAMGQDAVVEVP